MIRLTIVVGLLAVFGFVAYVIALLLTQYFSKKKKKKNNSQFKPNNYEPPF